MKSFLFLLSVFLISNSIYANIRLSVNDTTFPNGNSTIRGKSFILPGCFIISGACFVNSQLNKDLQEKIRPQDPTQKKHIDNYLQYTPACATIALEAAGLKGAHTPLQSTAIYALSNVILNAIVIPTKKYSHELRPDNSDYLSFPSGHTTEAFAGAELMRLEYKETQPWIGFTGYITAAATGYLRMYNNKHWFSDVITGAGIGIASTRLSYFIFDRFCTKIRLFNKKEAQTFFMPLYQNKQPGFCLVSKIR